MTTPEKELLPVIREDRDAAKAAANEIYFANSDVLCGADVEEMETVLGQAFAAHRLAFSHPKPNEGLAKEIADAIERFHDACPQGRGETGDGGAAGRAMCQLFYDNSDAILAALTPVSEDGERAEKPQPTRGPGAEWMRVCYGSDPGKGYSIREGMDGGCFVHLPWREDLGDTVRRICERHNAALAALTDDGERTTISEEMVERAAKALHSEEHRQRSSTDPDDDWPDWEKLARATLTAALSLSTPVTSEGSAK